MFGHRKCFERFQTYTGVPGGYRNPQGSLLGLLGPSGRRVLGNVVISKKFLRTRMIMVMHSNERGECRLCTLVDRKRKRYYNAVDVVLRLHDPTDPSTERTSPLRSAHVQLGDVPRTHDPAESQGRALSAQRHDDGDDVATDAGLRLSTATI